MRNEIRIKDSVFTDEDIVDGNVLIVQSLSGEDLQWDTLDATISFGKLAPTIFRPRNTTDGMRVKVGSSTENLRQLFGVLPYVTILIADPTKFIYGTEVRFLHKDSFSDPPRLVGKFFMQSITRVSKGNYKISCVSAVGLLDNIRHYGGMYEGASFADVAKSIIGDTFVYSIDPKLAKKTVYGWLPIDTRRNNLHHLLFAYGAVIIRNPDDDGNLRIVLPATSTYAKIPPEVIFLDSDTKYPEGVSSVTIVEHSFSKLQDEDVIFDGEVYGSKVTSPNGVVYNNASLISFSEPYHSLVCTGVTLLESGVNYAVVSPGICKLTGKKYKHAKRQITSRGNGTEVKVSEKDNDVFIQEETLVSGRIVDSVANRLYTYYSSTKIVNLNIVSKGQNPGESIEFVDPFSELTRGTIESLDAVISTQLKTKTKVVTGYEAKDESYSNVDVVTTSKNWTVPSGVSIIRMVLIGGGDGGDSGGNGTREHGGGKGKAGRGGSVYITSVTVKPGQNIAVNVGAGGAGGQRGGPGQKGGASKITLPDGKIFSSDNGAPSVSGYTDFINNVSYAFPGEDGKYEGGRAGGTLSTDKGTYYTGKKGKGRVSTYYIEGGYPGGPAYGLNGGNGEDGSATYTEVPDESEEDGYYIRTDAYSGQGGNGGSSTIPGDDATTLGSGGNGGNGGGQPGKPGRIYDRDTDEDIQSYWRFRVHIGRYGYGGIGSPGGKGKSGCVLIYYGDVE